MGSQAQVRETRTHSCLEAESPMIVTCLHHPLSPVISKTDTFPYFDSSLANHVIVFDPDA